MRRVSVIIFTLLALGPLSAFGQWTSIEPPLDAAPDGWTDLGASEPTKRIRLLFAIQQNDTELESFATNVSDLNHPSYGNHL
jgi:hypothetical protein